MRKAIAKIKTDGAGVATIFYNGIGQEMTAENKKIYEEIGYKPISITDGIKGVKAMYSGKVWELKML